MQFSPQRRSGRERRDVQILQLDSNNGGVGEGDGREVRLMQMDRDVLDGGGIGNDKDVQVGNKRAMALKTCVDRNVKLI